MHTTAPEDLTWKEKLQKGTWVLGLHVVKGDKDTVKLIFAEVRPGASEPGGRWWTCLRTFAFLSAPPPTLFELRHCSPAVFSTQANGTHSFAVWHGNLNPAPVLIRLWDLGPGYFTLCPCFSWEMRVTTDPTSQGWHIKRGRCSSSYWSWLIWDAKSYM